MNLDRAPAVVAQEALTILEQAQYLVGEATGKISLLPDRPFNVELHGRACDLYEGIKRLWHDVDLSRRSEISRGSKANASPPRPLPVNSRGVDFPG